MSGTKNKNKNKKWMFAAAVLVTAGALICGGSFAALGFDPGKLHTGKYITSTYDVNDAFSDISIAADAEKITLAPSEDGKCKVICVEDEKERHNVRVEGNALKIDKRAARGWQIGFRIKGPEITVYLPKDTYESLSINSDAGNVEIPGNFTFEEINIMSDAGDISCFASAKGDIRVKTDTGKIIVSELSAKGIELTSDVGGIAVSFVNCAASVEIKTDIGDAALENVTCKNLISRGDSGGLVLTKVAASEEFHIERDTGVWQPMVALPSSAWSMPNWLTNFRTASITNRAH